MASRGSMKGLKYIMNVLLIFFAIPLAVIVISIALEKLLNCPILVAAIIFSILLLIAVIFSSTIFFILTVIYTILSFLAAWISKYICRFICTLRNCSNLCTNICNTGNDNEDNYQVLTVNGRVRVLDSNNNNNNNQNNSGTFCGCYRKR